VNETLNALDGVDVVILSDYAKGVFNDRTAPRILQACQHARIPVVVDCKPANRQLFRGADLICPNDAEADTILPGFQGTHDLEQSLHQLRELLEARQVVVTLGANGICGLDDNGFFHHPGNPVRAIDAVGCGDTVRVGLAVGLAAGLPLSAAAALANDAAAVVVQKQATSTLTRQELALFMKEKAAPAAVIAGEG
jgi:D-beta-D-heptose 7-phosphate kinase/D-beta-D-heptose 1-phosphate adenosyltransferase